MPFLSLLWMDQVRLNVLDERRRGTRFIEHEVHSVLNPPESTGMGFWSFNPYVGCEFGCSYCYARFAHRYVAERARDAGRLDQGDFVALRGVQGWEGFEHQIFVKRRDGVLAALERDLARLAARSSHDGLQSVLIGSATDPYQPAEREFRITRAALERLRTAPPLSVTVITKSPLICRDIDVLLELQERHRVTVNLSLISVSRRLIRLFEVRSPMPHVRLRAVRTLVDAGVNAGLLVAPILPGITDSAGNLRRLLEAAKAHHARFAHPSPMRLYRAVQPVFLPIVQQHFPWFTARYRSVYRGDGHVPARYAAALRARFVKLAQSLGVPVHGEPDEDPRWTGAEQLTLFR